MSGGILIADLRLQEGTSKMTSISNLRIGKKISLVLGSIALLLAVFSTMSLWGLRTTERLADDSIDRLGKARLAETIASEQANISIAIGKMIFGKKASDDLQKAIENASNTRNAAIQAFKARANAPTDKKHGSDMADIALARTVANDRIINLLSRNQYPEALQEYRAPIAGITLRAKAKEAAEWQQQLVSENEKGRKQTSSTLWVALISGSIFAISCAIFGGSILTRSIATPLAAVAVHLGQIAEGNLSKDTPPEFQARGDEIGSLTRAMQKMNVVLRKMIQDIAGGIHVVSSSSSQLMASSAEMATGSRQASDKAHSVSAAAEEMSSNITSVATGMEQTTANLTRVASSTEQMTSTIGEIAQNSEKARRITDEATRQAARITEQINQLGIAAQEIGKVTEAITEISAQTNLLALNATIEAARAGSAGKGFAVVATEIKALAHQTAVATEDIKGRIAGVQSATAGGIAEIGKISKVILEVSAIVSSIAAAIEEQATATKDIARNIAQASIGVTDSNTRVAETSHVSREIAKDIVAVDQAAGEMASGSDHVRTSAGELSTVAETLRLTVSRFHT
jgi:methyl-accepting chemotaxis protein